MAAMVFAATRIEADEINFDRQFAQTVQPFVKKYCLECHAGEAPEGDLNLQKFATTRDVAKGYQSWDKVAKRLQAGEMPPEEAERHPSAGERSKVVGWIAAFRAHAATQPGLSHSVMARRLSNAEYDNTIRDLTGVDIRPTREFPVDPANEAGFDNSAESLAMSPTLVEKYLQAARTVSEYLLLKPEGLEFAPHPVVTDTDRDKYCVNRIVAFYKQQPTDLADYFAAVWRFEHRAALGMPNANLADIAAAAHISPKYLPKVWAMLTDGDNDFGPIATLRAQWRVLPPPDGAKEPASLRASCEKMRDWVIALREKIQPQFENLRLRGVGAGSQPFVLWKDQQYATHRMTFDEKVLQTEGDPRLAATADAAAEDPPTESNDFGRRRRRNAPQRVVPDADLTVPAGEQQRAAHALAFKRFAATFPDAFYISERGRIFLDREEAKSDKGRLLSAGFHSMMGFFRDDIPLCELILDDQQKRELDKLWQELDFITMAPIRQHTGYIWYERAESSTIRRWGKEFDVFRSEDKDITSEARLKEFADLYLAKARESYAESGGDEIALVVLDEFFKLVNRNVRALEKAHLDAEPKHVADLVKFAERAYRRPLRDDEREDLVGFYRSLRAADGMRHEDALRDTLVSVLMSPHFCYRLDLAISNSEPDTSRLPEGKGRDQQVEAAAPARQAGPTVVDYDYALASRLSYFLWSSMPDAELLAHATAGDLRKPEILITEAHRMLQDPRAQALATEFGGNWLDFRRFEEHNAVDRERFPQFTNELRQAMFEEPIRFLLDVMQQDRSVLRFLHADYTFVNAPLARFYGMPEPAGGDWVRVDRAGEYHRGGLLPMAVFMTKNSPGLRTSPVKRGYWVVRRLLGEVIPPPPPTVPELPADEAKTDIPLPQMLAKHRENKSCSVCHERFDSVGLVFEHFGPIGEWREKDLGDRPVSVVASFPDGNEHAGIAGLQEYIRQSRQNDFLDNLCRKLLSYGLSRTLTLADEAVVQEMRNRLAANDYRFSTLIETIVTSRQFTGSAQTDPPREGEAPAEPTATAEPTSINPQRPEK
jgi:hypothetical protein